MDHKKIQTWCDRWKFAQSKKNYHEIQSILGEILVSVPKETDPKTFIGSKLLEILQAALVFRLDSSRYEALEVLNLLAKTRTPVLREWLGEEQTLRNLLTSFDTDPDGMKYHKIQFLLRVASVESVRQKLIEIKGITPLMREYERHSPATVAIISNLLCLFDLAPLVAEMHMESRTLEQASCHLSLLNKLLIRLEDQEVQLVTTKHLQSIKRKTLDPSEDSTPCSPKATRMFQATSPRRREKELEVSPRGVAKSM